MDQAQTRAKPEGREMILCFCCERRAAPQPADPSECGCTAMYCTSCLRCATHCSCADELPPDALLQRKLDESLEQLGRSIRESQRRADQDDPPIPPRP